MEPYGEDTPVLVGQSGPLSGQRWLLKENITIGRDQGCDIMIPNRQVSRYHARFKISPGGIVLEDLGSKNGTHLNGISIEKPTLLRDGDVVQIAYAQQFVYLSSDATLPLESLDRIKAQAQLPRKLRLEKRSHQVWIGNSEVIPPLSVSQYHLLELLTEHEGQIVSRPDIISGVWGDEDAFSVSEQALDALVRRLRDRLAVIDPTHNYIITVRGHGLRLENPPLLESNR